MDAKIQAALDTSTLSQDEMDAAKKRHLIEQAALEVLNHRDSEFHVVKLCCLDLAVGNRNITEIEANILKNPKRYPAAECYMSVNDLLTEKPEGMSAPEFVYGVLLDLLRSWHEHKAHQNVAELQELLESLRKALDKDN